MCNKNFTSELDITLMTISSASETEDDYKEIQKKQKTKQEKNM